MISKIKERILDGHKSKKYKNYIVVPISRKSVKDELEEMQLNQTSNYIRKKALEELRGMWLGVEKTLKKPITYNDLKNETLLIVSDDMDYKIDLDTKQVIINKFDEVSALEHLAHTNPVLKDIREEELLHILG